MPRKKERVVNISGHEKEFSLVPNRCFVLRNPKFWSKFGGLGFVTFVSTPIKMLGYNLS